MRKIEESGREMLSRMEIQALELRMLTTFSDYCREEGLKYMLCGGTLLGAIRHKGFIPWDDDIDVCMPRPDYERLLDLTVRSTPLICNRFLFMNEENGFPHPFLRLFDTKVRVEHTEIQHEEVLSGKYLWLDIFPLDGLPENSKRLKEVYRKRNFLDACNVLCFATYGKGSTRAKAAIKSLVIPLVRLFGSKRFLKWLQNLCLERPYETSRYVGILSNGLYGVGERMEKRDIDPLVKVDFEGFNFPAMACWDSYLTGIYGDYMTLPPVEKRTTHQIRAWMIK